MLTGSFTNNLKNGQALALNQIRLGLYFTCGIAGHLSEGHSCCEPCYPCKTRGLHSLPSEKVQIYVKEQNSWKREKKVVGPDKSIKCGGGQWLTFKLTFLPLQE